MQDDALPTGPEGAEEITETSWSVSTDSVTTNNVTPDMTLTFGVTETGEYGNFFNGATDADGEVHATFTTDATKDITLSFSAYDVDSAVEFEVYVNGVFIAVLPTGVDNGLADHSLTLLTSDLVDGENVITFKQAVNPNFKWGVTNVLIEEISDGPVLTVGVTETGEYGQSFNGATEPDGRVEATFISTGADLVLTFDGYDVDSGVEIEVFLNDVSLGFLDPGVNDGLAAYEFFIPATDQLAGTNTLAFVQANNPAFKWGVTNILLEEFVEEPPIALSLGVTETGQYGNLFGSATDPDGLVHMTFNSSGADVLLTFDGYDVDNNSEMQVLLNGVSLGNLEQGVNNGLKGYNLLLKDEDLIDGENTITFVKNGDPTFKWGVTNVLVEELTYDATLTKGVTETGEYGQNFNGTTEPDGLVFMAFQNDGADVRLSFDMFDIDNGNEVELHLNGAFYSAIAAGVNNGISSYSLTIDVNDLVAGENVITFVKNGDPSFMWGVTNVLVEDVAVSPDVPLTLGVTETGEYGRDFGAAVPDADGLVTMTFEGTGNDLVLTFDAYDIDNATEVEVLLDGVSLGFLPQGIDNGITSHTFNLDAADVPVGTHTISFVKNGDPTFTWGVTNVLVEEAAPELAIPLTYDVLETGEYGQNFNGATDDDGQVNMTFTGSTNDIRLTFKAYDVDSNSEMSVMLNGALLYAVPLGVDNGLSSHQVVIPAGSQLVGDNTLTFVQNNNPLFKWGVTDVLVEEVIEGAPIALTMGVTETGEYGEKFNGATDSDGIIEMTFQNTLDLPVRLTFDAFDVDSGTEIQVFLNGESLGNLPAGVNNGLSSHVFEFATESLFPGENTITFQQNTNPAYVWGITNVLVEEIISDADLIVGVMETGSYGQAFNGATDEDGEVIMTFEQSAGDKILRFDAFDVDSATEMYVMLNDEIIYNVPAGIDNGLTTHQITLDEADLLVGENKITFVQANNPAFKWGVTNVIVAEPDQDIPILLSQGVPDIGNYGNGFRGQLDFDGKLTAEFEGTGEDARLRFTAFDVDSDQEMEVYLNGELLATLEAGKNDDLKVYEIIIPSENQLVGTNSLEFVNTGEPTFIWGLTEIRLDPVDPTFTPTLDGWDDLWHLRAAGDIERVWAEYDGDGISVGIYDDGFDKSHVEFDQIGKYDASKEINSSVGILDPSTGGSSHGTAVAGIIGADQDDAGVVGIAFNSSLTGVNMITGPAGAGNTDLTVFTEAMNGMTQFDVVNHSWGSTPGFDQTDESLAFNAAALPTFENAADNGRGGLGTITVKSAGNDNANSNGDLLDASRFTITVGAHGDDGMVSDYSNYGSNLLVSAPSNGSSIVGLGVFTTDVSGTGGYNTAESVDGGDYTGTDAATGFGGTSAAAPVVSGVVALMLEANPALGWRDVQEILAYSSRHTGTLIGDTQVDDPIFGPLENGEWMFNAAANFNGGGLHHSIDYGFGAVDVYAAVRMAEVWLMFNDAQTSANEASWLISDSNDQLIASSSTLTIDLDFTGSTRLVETMEIDLNLDDASVDVFLISQSGTRVQILEASEAGSGALDWSFNAQAFRGEWLTGTWQLEIVNADGGDVTLLNYSVESFGLDPANELNDDFAAGEHEVYHFTDEVFADIFYDDATGTTSSMADDAARMLLTDTGNTADWINMAAMTGDIRFIMQEGETAKANGMDFVTIDTGTVIENLVTGDGNDLIVGNAADNEIHLGRGNDAVYGLEGADTLFGGAGDDEFWFNPGSGADVIGDFMAGADTDDVVVLDGYGLDFASLVFADDTLEGSTTLDLGAGDSITFLNAQAADFVESDFLFDPFLIPIA